MLLAGGNGPKRKDDAPEFRLAETSIAGFCGHDQSQQTVLMVERFDQDTLAGRDVSFRKTMRCEV
jgi:hypothetical protein